VAKQQIKAIKKLLQQSEQEIYKKLCLKEDELGHENESCYDKRLRLCWRNLAQIFA
jgi:hypothetical protein